MRYLSPRREIEAALPAVVDMLRLRSEGEALSVLSQAEIELEETGYDNWDGGTATWTAYPTGAARRVPRRRERRATDHRPHEGDLERVLDPGADFWVAPAFLIWNYGLLNRTGLVIDLTRIESETRRVTHQMVKPNAKIRIAGVAL